jgi:fucose permease
MAQTLSLVGAALVLGAFAGLQLGRLRPSQRRYQLANLVGAALLCTSALMTESWGFVILNAVWAAFAVATLIGVVSPDARE